MSSAPDRPIACYVTDRKALGVADFLPALPNQIRAAIAAGADWVQIREKDLTSRALFDLVRAALGIRNVRGDGGDGAHIIVNDRLDVALAAGAHGVHLGHQSMPARDVAGWCANGNAPRDFCVGVSCHSVEQARQAEQDGAAYVFFGPIFETPSKIPFGKPHGTPELAAVARAVRIPVIAIGGVNELNAADCIRAGAAGIAAIRLFQQPRPSADDLKTALDRIRTAAQ